MQRKFKKFKEMFYENLRLFVKFIIIHDTIEEISDIFINFQIYLWERKDFGLTLKKNSNFEKNQFIKIEQIFKS